MGKVVTEDEGQSKLFKPQVYQSNRGRSQNRGNYQDRFRSNNTYRGHSVYNQNFRGRLRYNFYTIGSYGYNAHGNQRYGRKNSNYRRNGYKNQIMTGIGVGHLKDRIEVGEVIEVQVTIGCGQALEQAQIETELGVLNVGSMIILQGNVQQGKRVGRQSKYNRCLIWMRMRQYYRFH